MKTSKRILIMAVAAITLLSVPTEMKASSATEQIVLGESVETKNADQLISEKSYKDEDGNEITEKIYVNFEKMAASGESSNSVIIGKATYRKEEQFYIKTGKNRKEKIKCFVEGTFMFKDHKATLISSRGAVTHCPQGVTITRKKVLTGSNYAKFRFYAKSNFSSNREYFVKLTARGDGGVY